MDISKGVSVKITPDGLEYCHGVSGDDGIQKREYDRALINVNRVWKSTVKK